jgi:hypothetical protein
MVASSFSSWESWRRHVKKDSESLCSTARSAGNTSDIGVVGRETALDIEKVRYRLMNGNLGDK